MHACLGSVFFLFCCWLSDCSPLLPFLLAVLQHSEVPGQDDIRIPKPRLALQQPRCAFRGKEEAVFEGKYYQVKGAINQPKGLQKPHIPLLIGGSGEKVTLKLVARYGDACNISNLETDFTTLNHKLSILKKHCENIGRDYRSISPTILLNCVIGETDKEALSKLGPWIRNAPLDYLRERALIGTPDMILQRLFMYEKMGIQEIIMYMPDAAKLDSVRLFARECMQAFVSNRVNESSASLGLDSRRSESQEAE